MRKNIDNRQFKFRKQKSPIDAISKILNGFREKEKIAAFFLDLKKTNDKINRSANKKPKYG